MKRNFLVLFLLLFPLSDYAAAQTATLQRVSRLDSGNLVQLFFTFDTLPQHSYNLTGKRLNLFLDDTRSAPKLSMPKSDSRIVKFLIDRQHDKTVVSLFFRYPPLKVELKTTPDKRLVLGILLGNEYSVAYRNFARQIGEVSVVKQHVTDYSNPLVASPYRNDWASFIARYEPQITIKVPVRYTFPPFPVLRLLPATEATASLLSQKANDLADKGLWGDLQGLLLGQLQTEKNPEKQKLLALTYGEALLRQKNFDGAYKQFYLLWQNYPEENVGVWARYLEILATAKYSNPYVAAIQADDLATQVAASSTIVAYLQLFRIENALATHNLEKLGKLLADQEFALPKRVLRIEELRQADLAYARHKYVRADAAYSAIDDKILSRYPYSLNGYCDTLYRHRRYSLSTQCYRKLANLVVDDKSAGMVAYRLAMARLKNPRTADTINMFADIANTYPGTEAAFRAAVKKVDLLFLAKPNWMGPAARNYKALAKSAPLADIREESTLKEAIMYALQKKAEKSIPVLMQLIRDFGPGGLRVTAQALLISQLPGEIKHLVDSKKYLSALTLAKQNKLYFEKGWIRKDIFVDIAKAYDEANLYGEAEKTYLYLYDISEPNEREQYFPPLIRSIFNQGNYRMVDDYASQYAYLYPKGKYTTEILSLRLQALTRLGAYQDALKLLPKPLPGNGKLRELAAVIYFYTNQYETAGKILTDIGADHLQPRQKFILAECEFNTGKYQQAQPLYQALEAKSSYHEQALFRLGQIAERQGQNEKSLKFYQKIVETGKDSVWRSYAERELEYQRLSKSIDRTLGK